MHNLGAETKAPGRNLRLDEVRYALSALNADRLIPKMSKPALSSIIQTLLTAETPLIQSELAARADVSARSVRSHTARLAAFDFVRETEAGWRFALPFHADDERDETILPWFVASEDGSTVFVRDVFAEVVYDLLDPGRYGDPDDPVGGALFGDPSGIMPALRSAWEWLDPWVSAVGMLLDTPGELPPSRETVATVGIIPKQASLLGAG